MAKLTSQQRQERRLKEILRAYQREQPLVSPSPDATPGPTSPPPVRADLPQFDPKFLKSDLIRSLFLTILSLGIILTTFFLLP